jgi:S-formylglutathione hydrolase FrmB
MSFCHVQWFSNILGKQVGSYVILPDAGKPPYATYYLLHGLSDDYTIWHRRTRIEMYVANLPLVVVMPDGYRGFYTNCNEGPRYADYIGRELPDFMERTFPLKKVRGGRCVGGLSMGGYGALRIALGFADRFISANSHSGAVMRGTQPSPKNKEPEFQRVFGPRPEGSEHDLVALARKAKAAGTLPKMLIDCGVEDFLIEENRRFHAHLQALRVPHEYAEFPGAHEWGYWDQHVQEALAFHAGAMKIKRMGS